MNVRYAYAITTALLVGGAAATMTMQQPVGAQVAQNEPGAIAAMPQAGAPMSFADLAAKLQPAVVNISTTQRIEVQSSNPFAGTPFGSLFGDQGSGSSNGRPVTREATSLGSGFIVSADGYIVTNNHVISGGRDGAAVDSITVTLPDRTEYKAKLVGRDVVSDLAVLKIDAKNLPFVRFGDSTRARVGDWIVAIGNPFGLGGTVTSGIVSALHRNTGQGGAYDRYIQTDASINMGNSGGPMFDLNGNVIGINTAIFSPSGGNVGIGFAIPAEQAKPVIDTLMKGGKVKRGYLGVQIQPLTDDIAGSLGLPKNRGELIAGVEPNQGAAKGGIKQGDVVTKVNGQLVTPDETLSYLVSNTPVGSRIPIELIRDGKPMTVQVVVGERPPEEQLAATLGNDNSFDKDGDDEQSTQQAAQASLGIAVQPLTPAIARTLGVPSDVKGVVISGVDPSSDAAAKTLKRGDVILTINRKPATSAQDVVTAVKEAAAENRPSVLLQVQRGSGRPVFVGVKVKNG